MRICPCCGYVDPQYWRPRPWDVDEDYCQLEDYKKMMPELYQRLVDGEKEVKDSVNIYRLSGKGKNFVTRRALFIWKTNGWRTPTEKYKPQLRREGQLKL